MMKTTETMLRLMIFIDETDQFAGRNLGAALLQKLQSEGISGASVLRGSAGFGSHGKVHTTTILDLAASLPQILVAMDTPDKINAVIPHLEEMIGEGLLVLDEVSVVKLSRK